MSFVMGFGKGEEDAALSIIRECLDVFADGEKLNTAIKKVKDKYAKIEKDYKELGREDAPERYTYFFHFCPTDTFAEFTMMHINRRHPFSPDGWALFQTRWALFISAAEDEPIIYKQVA